MQTWVCLAGGNALGAFYVGAWSSITAAGLNVTRISGASIGAVVAAVIAGRRPDRRQAALDSFLSAIGQTRAPWAGRRGLVAATMLGRNANLFVPSFHGLAEIIPFMPPDVSAFTWAPMQRLLERSIDFDILNNGGMEVTLTVLDAESGDIVAFRNTDRPLTLDHVMASTALPGLFRPVQIKGRTFLDPGLVENLPLPCLLDRKEDADRMTQTLNGVAERAQALGFAGQSARIIQNSDLTDHRFLHLALDDPEDGFAGKAFDYSSPTLIRRRQLGADLAAAALADWGMQP